MASFIDVQEILTGAIRGQRAGNVKTDSKIATAAMPAGVVVVFNTEDKVKVPVLTGDVTAKGMGVTAYLPEREPTGDGVNEYATGDVVSFVTAGDIWVICEDSPTAGGQVFVRFTANGGLTQLGACRSDADSGKAVALSNAMYLTAAVGGIAKIRCSFPQ